MKQLSDLERPHELISLDDLKAFSFDELMTAVVALRSRLRESDSRVAEFERTVDAAKEVLHCELYDVAIGMRHDILSYCCAAREQLAVKRKNDNKEL